MDDQFVQAFFSLLILAAFTGYLAIGGASFRRPDNGGRQKT